MNNLVNFILESGVSLALLSIIYILFLRKETFFHLNRVFLLFSLAFSIVLPFLKFRVYEPKSIMLSEVTVTPYRNLMESVTIYGQDLSGSVVQSISSSRIIIFIYLAGFALFSLRLVYRLIQIGLLVNNNKVDYIDGVKFVSLKKDFSPFSFLSYVFINPDKQQEKGYERIVAHEVEHIKQGHTFDVLILEIMAIFQWFNPFIWILKRVIRENHEFLADRAVLDSGVSTAQYKQLLLSQSLGFQVELGNGFNSSLVKKRIKMLSKLQSSKLANLKYVLGVFSIIGLLIIFACEQKEVIGGHQEEVVESKESLVTMSLLDDKIRVEGDEAAMEQIQKLFKDKSKYEFESDSLGNIYLVKSKEPEIKKLDEEEQVFFIVEEMPVFPGGDLALRKYIANTIKYPDAAVENGIQGKVYVTFVVTTTGHIANTRIARGVDPSLDKEAIRVVNNLPRWKPGTQRGKPVNVSYTVPINFVLQ